MLDQNLDCERKYDKSCQTHVHEYLGSTTIFEEIPHNHRFAGVTSEAIPSGNSHVHQLLGNSDFLKSIFMKLGLQLDQLYQLVVVDMYTSSMVQLLLIEDMCMNLFLLH